MILLDWCVRHPQKLLLALIHLHIFRSFGVWKLLPRKKQTAHMKFSMSSILTIRKMSDQESICAGFFRRTRGKENGRTANINTSRPDAIQHPDTSAGQKVQTESEKCMSILHIRNIMQVLELMDVSLVELDWLR